MKIRNKKSSRTVKRALAFAMSFALAMSTFAVSPSADAASKKAPKLSVKKKTLYYNQAGKKTYTLKVKKNKVKAIKKTTWKTSKKSVVAISSKKKTSVKLTAKKAGTAKITATVKYTVKGSKKVQTKKLTCTVSSKKAAAVTPTATATATTAATATATATAGATATATANATAPAEPTATAPTEPTAVPVASAITLDKAEATIGTAAGKNTVTLTATVKDAAGNAMTDQAITWTSDKAEVATVDEKGVVTAVADGEATITAALGALSATCKVTVDGVVPTIAKAEVTDYKTITVTLSEEVTGTPDVKVYLNAGTAAMKTTEAALAADGKSIVITNSEALKVATYKVVVNGLTDKVGNAMAKDASAEAKKETSTIKEFVPCSKEAPASNAKDSNGISHANKSIKVYYTVVDQYGEAMDAIKVDAANLTATAQINGSDYPLDIIAVNNNMTDPEKGKNCVVIGYSTVLTVGKVVDITLTNKVSDTVKYSSTFSVTLVKPDGVGTAASIESIVADSKKMKNAGTETAPEYTLNASTTPADNSFTITSKLLDKYACPATEGKVKYVSSNKDILYFDGATKEITKKHSEAVTVYAKNKGEATITAYLENDDTVSFKMTIKINPVALSAISVSENKTIGEKNATDDTKRPTNGVTNYYPITLNNGNGITGLKAADLQVKVLSGDATVTLYDGIGTTTTPDTDYHTESGTIYVNVVPTADGEEKEIKYIIYTGTYDETTKRVKDGKFCEVTVKSDVSKIVSKIDITSFGQNVVTANSTQTTEYKLFNAQGENVTSLVPHKTLTTTDESVVTGKSAQYNPETKKGELKVTVAADAKGKTAVVALTAGNAVAYVTLTVAAEAAVMKMEFAGNGDVIKNDELFAWNKVVDGDRAKVGDDVYKVVPVTFINQFGNSMNVTESALTSYMTEIDSTLDEKKKEKMTIVGLHKFINDSGADEYRMASDDDGNEVTALGVIVEDTREDEKDTDDAAHYITFTNGKSGAERKEIGNFGITPLAERILTTFKDSAGDVISCTATTGATISGRTLVALDQYGASLPYNDKGELTVVDNQGEKTGDITISYPNNWSYAYTLKVNAKKDTTVSVKYVGAYARGKEKTFDVIVKVVAASTIDALKINSAIDSNASAKSHDSSKYLVQMKQEGATQLTLGATATSAGAAVDVDPETAIVWEIVKSDLTYVGGENDGKKADCTVSVKNNKVIVSSADNKTVKGSITVSAKSLNGKATAEYTFNVSNEESVPQANTYYLSKEASVGSAFYQHINAYSWDKDSELGKFFVYGIDQYGLDVEATKGIKSVVSMDTEKLEVKWAKGATQYADHAIYCRAVEAATTDVVINFAGSSKSITVPVTAIKKTKDKVVFPVVEARPNFELLTLDLNKFNLNGNNSSSMKFDEEEGALVVTYNKVAYTGSYIDLTDYNNCSAFTVKVASNAGVQVILQYKELVYDEDGKPTIDDWKNEVHQKEEKYLTAGEFEFQVNPNFTPEKLLINNQDEKQEVNLKIYSIKAKRSVVE